MIRSLPVLLAVSVAACFDPSDAPLDDEGSGGATEADGSDTEGPGSTSQGSNDSTSSGGAEETGSGPAACGGGAGVCVAVPAGWSGPVSPTFGDADRQPDCPDGADAEVVAQADLSAPEATCECDCKAATGAYCTEAVLMAWGDDDACSNQAVFSQTLQPAGGGDPCNFMPGGDATGEVPVDGASHWSLVTESLGGACDPDATSDIPAASYETAVAGCAAPVLEGECEGDTSCHEASSGGICVWRLGEHECTDADFSARTVYYGGELEDTRECTACSCGSPQGSCPTTVADLFEGYYCNGQAQSVDGCSSHCFGGGTCETYAISALLTLGPAQASCPPSGGELMGALTETDPVTFCCTE